MKFFLTLILAFCMSFHINAEILSSPIVQLPVKEYGDTLRIKELLDLAARETELGDKIAVVGAALSDAGTDSYYTTDSIGALRMSLSEFTPLTFVNTALAVARTSQNMQRPTWRHVLENFESLSCRRGENKGYPSIMYHSSDWLNDNIFRGNLKELTENFSGVVVRTKSLDEMTRNRTRFKALNDSSVFENIRMTEMGFRTHRVPTLKKETIQKKEILSELRNGDIIILVPSRDGIDYYDIGFVAIKEGMPYYIHLSPVSGKVKVEEEDLTRYFKLMTKAFQGYRIVRAVN